MSVGWIIVIAIVAVLALLAVGGAIATAQRTRRDAARLQALVRRADTALAAARAGDRGVERASLEAAAREAFAARHGDRPIRALHLVQVLDRPGSDEDEAVFRVVTDEGEHDIVLGRRDGDWVGLTA